jgi:acetyl-CoA carboxylase biotin carboxyl carrier protein
MKKIQNSSNIVVDLDLLKSIADLMKESDITDLSWEAGKIQLSRQKEIFSGKEIFVKNHSESHEDSVFRDSGALKNSKDKIDILSDAIRSPLVGTAYRASDPQSPPFISIGSIVVEGDTLLIVEAMKVMNPIKAPHSGTIEDILIHNGDPVEYNQPLVILKK